MWTSRHQSWKEVVGTFRKLSDKNTYCSEAKSIKIIKPATSDSSKINIKEMISMGSSESQNLFESYEKILKEIKPNNFGKYSCTECDYEIKMKGSLRRHYVAKHVGIIFKCGKCSKELTSQSGLKSHMEYVHEQFNGSWSYSNNLTGL